MMGSVLTKVFGNKNERVLKQLRPLIDKINRLEPELQKLDDPDLAAKTVGFKERVAKFDSHGPFAKADSIPKAVRRRGLPPEALSPPVRRTVRPPAREF